MRWLVASESVEAQFQPVIPHSMHWKISMTGPGCAVMCNLINTHTHTNTHTHRRVTYSSELHSEESRRLTEGTEVARLRRRFSFVLQHALSFRTRHHLCRQGVSLTSANGSNRTRAQERDRGTAVGNFDLQQQVASPRQETCKNREDGIIDWEDGEGVARGTIL